MPNRVDEIRVSDPLTEVAEARRNGHADPLQDRTWVAANEAALFDAIVEQQAAVIWQPFEVPRIRVQTPDGPRALVFRVRGLTQPELDDCERKSDMPTGRRGPGGAPETKRNTTRQKHLTILVATHPDDAAVLWRSEALRTRLKVAGVVEMVGAILRPGEAERVATEVYVLSGYLPDDSEIAKSASDGAG